MSFKVGDRVVFCSGLIEGVSNSPYDNLFGTVTDDSIVPVRFTTGLSDSIEVLWDDETESKRPNIRALRILTKLDEVLK